MICHICIKNRLRIYAKLDIPRRWFGLSRISCEDTKRKILAQTKARSHVNYDELIRSYQLAARNSILIRTFGHVQNIRSYLQSTTKALITTDFNFVHYTLGTEHHYYLCDIGRKDAEELVQTSPHVNANGVPVRLRILCSNAKISNTRISSTKSIEFINVVDLNRHLMASSSLTDQMNRLVEYTEITRPGLAMRFFCASLIEDILPGLFPFCLCLPFGSSVNGFGQRGGDLDMALQLENEKVTSRLKSDANAHNSLQVALRSFDAEAERLQSQKLLDIYGAVITHVMPFCSKVQRILQARVPIIKFMWSLGGLSCDLSVTNMTGFEMAKILWVYGQLDERFRPLVFTVRFWAKHIGLTRPVAGPHITNFQLICLVLFFMQIHDRIKLPPISDLKRCASSFDDYGVVSRPDKVIYRTSKDLSASELLKEFFEYYADFDFDHNGVSLISGQLIGNKNGCEMYIHNPVETSLNVSKNVRKPELDAFVYGCKQALSILKNTRCYAPNSRAPWGLLELCRISLSNRPPSQPYVKDNVAADADTKSALDFDSLLRDDFNSNSEYVEESDSNVLK